VSKNGNLLLNFPPRPDGTLDGDELKILDGMAAWMAINGEAIYGTRPWKIFGENVRKLQGGMFNEGALRYTAKDVRFTTKGDVLYAIALGWPEDRRLTIRSLAAAAGKITGVTLLGHAGDLPWSQTADGSRGPVSTSLPLDLPWSQTADGLIVTLPEKKPCDHAFALKILGGHLEPVPLPKSETAVGPERDGRIVLPASEAEIHGNTPQYEQGGEKDQIGFWADPNDYVSWNLKAAKAGTYDVAVTYSCQPGAEGSRFTVQVAGQKLVATSRPTQSWSTYRTEPLGSVTLAKPGVYELAVKPSAETTWKVIGLKSITLVKAVGTRRVP
jgi:alpha-L-fucosidase